MSSDHFPFAAFGGMIKSQNVDPGKCCEEFVNDYIAVHQNVSSSLPRRHYLTKAALYLSTYPLHCNM